MDSSSNSPQWPLTFKPEIGSLPTLPQAIQYLVRDQISKMILGGKIQKGDLIVTDTEDGCTVEPRDPTKKVEDLFNLQPETLEQPGPKQVDPQTPRMNRSQRRAASKRK